MEECGFLFEVRTELLNTIYTGFRFKWLNINILFYTSRGSTLRSSSTSTETAWSLASITPRRCGDVLKYRDFCIFCI
jgi:hypothetical protein